MLQSKVIFEKDSGAPTEIELRALKAARKAEKKAAKKQALAPMPKRNVRKRR
jgi:hypothetical protein